MDRSILLCRRDKQLVLELIEACHSGSGQAYFERAIYPILRELLPHEMFAYGHIDTHCRRIRHYVNVSFPPEYLAQCKNLNDEIECPLATKWISTLSPVRYRYGARSQAASGSPSTAALRDNGINNVIADGVVDGFGKVGTCYAFACASNDWGRRNEQILRWVVPHVHVALSGEMLQAAEARRPELTRRERDVLYWATHGKTDEETGAMLGISVFTVRIHMQNTIRKLGAANRAHAVALALRRGLVAF